MFVRGCWSLPFALARALAMALSLAGAAQAVEFDEKVRAPRAASGVDLRSRLESVAAKVKGPAALAPLDALRSSSFARERFDARWMLGQMVDARTPMPEIESLGFKADGKGSYTIDTREHPQWRPLEERIQLLSSPKVLGGLERELAARGLNAEDFAKIREYLSLRNLDQERAQSKLAFMLSAGKMAKKMQKLGRLDDQFMASLSYQRARELAEVERRWAAGLLDSLPPQGQRVLASYLTEVPSTTSFVPEPTADAYRQEKELLLRPDFERLIRDAFAEGNL
jgi:hypothetical protein